MHKRNYALVVYMLFVSLTGCGALVVPPPVGDGGSADVGDRDAGELDSGSSDGGLDGGDRDSGGHDSGDRDSGLRDAGPGDGGPHDAGVRDGGPRDAGATMFLLTTALLGTASGSIESTPPGIMCGSTCAAEFIDGQTVMLVATPYPNSEFVGWTGACSGATPQCSVDMTLAMTVSAEFRVVPSVEVGTSHTCAVSEAGAVRCWGNGLGGKLGHGNTNHVGDGQGLSIQAAGDVPVGATVVSVGLGVYHTCAVTAAQTLRCWGGNATGNLGYNNTTDIGDGVGPSIAAAGDVAVGGPVQKVVGGFAHTCALLVGGAIRCWGGNFRGQLGYGHQLSVGESSGLTILQAGDVPVGAPAIDLCAGSLHTCAVTSVGEVRCWGHGLEGQLGQGTLTEIGDGVGPSIATAGSISLSAPARSVACGVTHTCATLTSGAVRCWGSGASGQLGYNSTSNIGDQDAALLAQLGDVAIGGPVENVDACAAHTCAVLINGSVRCWGSGVAGRLGRGTTSNIGDGSGFSIIQVGDVPTGGMATSLSCGVGGHTCATTSGGSVRCWGGGASGRLGHNNEANIGDGTGPSIISAGDVPVW